VDGLQVPRLNAESVFGLQGFLPRV